MKSEDVKDENRLALIMCGPNYCQIGSHLAKLIAGMMTVIDGASSSLRISDW
jgi:hypothetical protein